MLESIYYARELQCTFKAFQCLIERPFTVLINENRGCLIIKHPRMENAFNETGPTCKNRINYADLLKLAFISKCFGIFHVKLIFVEHMQSNLVIFISFWYWIYYDLCIQIKKTVTNIVMPVFYFKMQCCCKLTETPRVIYCRS